MDDEVTTWATSSAGRVVFGRGAVRRTGLIASRLGSRVLVCTDSLLMSAGVVAPVLSTLREHGIDYEVFDGGEPEVSRSTVENALNGVSQRVPDVVIGVGGGSNLDLAKGVALLLAHGGELSDYYGESLVPGPTIPIIAVPTTAGTGSEVTPVAVFSDEQRKLKAGVSSTHLLPTWAIDDPELTLSCPPSVTAHSGLDALSHAIESICTASYETFDEDPDLVRIFSGKNAYSDALAVKAVTLIARSLRTAVSDGQNIAAREQMMLASLLAGMAFGAAGTGLAHALQYPIGARTRTPHGLGIALLLPAVMRFNAPARAPELALIQRLLEPQSGLTDEAAATAAGDAVKRLADDVGVSVDLAQIGIRAADIPGIAAEAFGIERLIRLNPRPLVVDDLESILRSLLPPATQE